MHLSFYRSSFVLQCYEYTIDSFHYLLYDFYRYYKINQRYFLRNKLHINTHKSDVNYSSDKSRTIIILGHGGIDQYHHIFIVSNSCSIMDSKRGKQ